MNARVGEHLKDLFTTEIWQDHFSTLSDSFGFTLSIYSQNGKPLFVPESPYSFCRGLRASSSAFNSQCESYCYPLVMKALSTAKPEIYKCYAKIANFAFPIEYGDEKAVILGQGSFPSYEDFRECMNLTNSVGFDALPITTPLTFTSMQHTEKVCGFVADLVHRLLKDSQETVTLKKKFEDLKSIIGTWGSASEESPETLYHDMISKLSTLLDIENIAILVHDSTQGRYTSLYSLSKNRMPVEILSINEQNPMVKDFTSGKPFILSAEPVADPQAGFLNGMGALYFFPIKVANTIEAILRISDTALKESDKQIIIAFCRQTALAIENHRLHQTFYQKLNRFAAVLELTKGITSILNHETLLKTILEMSAELLKAEQGSLMLINHETEELLLEAKKGMVEGVTEKLKINRGEGIAGKVVEHGEALLVTNVENDPRTNQKNRAHYKTPSFISVPLKIDDRIIGVLNLSDKMTGAVFNEEDLKLVQSFATHVAVILERNVFYNKSEELKKLTITDPLTGLLNRRYLYERLKDEAARSERHGKSLSLLMLDVDGFKCCNDTFGHLFGDKTLKAIAEITLNTVRSMDVVARFGGDEFMVILPETSEPLAREIAERIRSNVEKQPLLTEREAPENRCTLTVSIGIVCYPQHGQTFELLLEHADKALYRAKNKGKNTIEVFS